jgi:hypothetical protein
MDAALTALRFSDNLENPFAPSFMSPPRAPQHTLRLTNADFDAYLPERATSNAFTRPRLELKQRMLAWAKGVVARLAELGVHVEVAASDEHPSLRNGRRVDYQRVFFWRDASGRAQIEKLIDRKKSLSAAIGDPAPHQSHAFLALRIDAKQLEVGVEVHPDAWVDTRNLRARLADPALTLELTSALEALPEQFAVGVADGGSSAGQSGQAGRGAPEIPDRIEAQKVTSETVRTLLDRGEREGRSLWIGWSVPRDVVITHSAVLGDQLEDAALALGPIYKLIAWAPDNDVIVLGREVESAKLDRARAHDEAERERSAWEARRARDRDSEGRKRRELPPTESADVPSVSDRSDRKRRHEAEPAREAAKPAKRDKRAEIVKPPLRSLSRRAPRVTEVDPSAPIEKGTRVQVLAGPFVGKIGVVQELDGKGAARVMLGLLAARLEVKNLIASAEGKDRPALATSHRKPIPARS